MKNTCRKAIAIILAIFVVFAAAAPLQTGAFAVFAEADTVESDAGSAGADAKAADADDGAAAPDAGSAGVNSGAAEVGALAETAAEAAKDSGKDADKEGTDLGSGAAKEDRDADATAEDPADVTLAYEGKDYDITLTGGSKTGLTEDTALDAREIPDKSGKDGGEYEEYMSLVESALGTEETGRKIRFVKFYDISLTDADGQDMEPSAPVDVSIKFDKKLASTLETSGDGELSVIHFTEDADTGKIDAEVIGTDSGKGSDDIDVSTPNDQLQEVSFTAGSFSVYAVVYTVDFHYGDGEYDFSIAGESSILLSEVFERLHIEDIDLADIDEVTFSDPSLIKVEKAEGAESDWLLTSLAPFDTEETLAITLTDGSKITINVTDAPGDLFTIKIGNQAAQNCADWDDLVSRIPTTGTNAIVIEVLGDAAITQPLSYTRNGAFTINGNGHELTANASVSGDLISYSGTAALVINDLTINGASGSAAALVKRSAGNGAAANTLSCTNVTFKGKCASLMDISGGTAAATFSNCRFEGDNATGALLNISTTGSVTISGDSETVSYFRGAASETNNSLISRNSNGVISIINTAIIANYSTGDVIERSNGNGNITISNCTLSGSLAENANGALLHDTGSGQLVFSGEKIFRNKTAATLFQKSNAGAGNGNAISFQNITYSDDAVSEVNGGFLDVASGVAAIVNISSFNYTANNAKGSFVNFSGGNATAALNISDSNIVGASTGTDLPLIKNGNGILTLTDVTVSGFRGSSEGICAVDAVNASAVNVSGSTTITGNTAGGAPANLAVRGTALSVPNNQTFSGNVGVYSNDCYTSGAVFAKKGNASTVISGQFTNDKNASLGHAVTGTNIYWDRLVTESKFYIIGTHSTLGTNTRINYGSLNEAIAGTSSFSNTPVNIYGMVSEYEMTTAVSTNKAIVIQPGQDVNGALLNRITIKRGDVEGDLITANNVITLSGVTIDGENKNVDGSLLSMSGNYALTLIDAVLEHHAASTSGDFAVDARKVTTAANVKISGSTTIAGNEANGEPANLAVGGIDRLNIPANSTLSGNVGVYSTDHFADGVQFGTRANATNAFLTGHITNDRNARLEATVSGTKLIWSLSPQLAEFYITGTHSTHGANTTIYYASLNEAITGAKDFTATVNIYGMVSESTMTDAVATPNKAISIQPGNDVNGNPLARITVKRGDVEGDLITANNAITLSKVTIDGENKSVSGSLLKLSGNFALTLADVVVENHKATAADVCAVDASKATTAANVKVYGGTTITGNTANGADANLSVKGSTTLQIPTGQNLSGTVGVTTPSHFNGSQFAALGNQNSSTGFDNFKSDYDASLVAIRNNTAVLWAEHNTSGENAVRHGNSYYYKGLEYDLDTGSKTSNVTGYDTNNYSNWTGIPVIPVSVPYGDWNYAVTDITYFNSAAHLKNKNLMFEDDMLNKMANGAAIDLPEVVTEYTAAIDAAVDGYVEGNANEEVPGNRSVWKKAELDPDTNIIEYSVKYLQLMSPDQPLDFIFGVDQTSTMCTHNATANGVKAPRVMWMMAMLQKTSYELIGKNGNKYDNRVAFVTWGNSATKSSFMASKADIDAWFSGSDAYAHAEEGTDHRVCAKACVELAELSLNAQPGRMPVVIYLSDFEANADTNKDYEYVKKLREATYKTYAVVVFHDSTSYAQYYQNSGIEMTSDPANFIDIFSKIVKDAIGYYLDKPLTVTDDLSTPLAGFTPEAGESDGLATSEAGRETWSLGEQDPLLSAGQLYENTFSVDLGDDIYSGSLTTNNDLVVEENGREVNKIPASRSPVISRGLNILVKDSESENPIEGAVFELRDRYNAVVWTGTSDVNGALLIPYGTGAGQCDFLPSSEYTLKQLTTGNETVLPAGSWTLRVDNDYKINSTVTASGNGENRTLPTTAKRGKLVVYNDIEPVVTYDANGGKFGDETTEKTDAVDFSTTETSFEYTVTADAAFTPSHTNTTLVFVGWNTRADGNGTNYKPGVDTFDVYREANDSFITLYAKWAECKSLTITNENYGAYSNADDSFTVTLTLEPANNQDPINDANDERLGWITGGNFSVSGGKATTTFEIYGMNGSNTKVFGMVPVGWTYTVKETADKGYTAKYKLSTDSESSYAEEPNGKTGVLNADTTVNIRSARENVVPSGIAHGPKIALMFAFMLLSAVLVRLIFAIRRRKAMTRG